MEKSWQLMRECRDYIKENSSTWRKEEMERRKIREKEERLGRAKAKQEAVRNAGEKRLKEKKIDEFMRKLPRVEKKMIEAEDRRKDAVIMKEFEENLWRKWRGKVDKKIGKPIREMAAENVDRRIEQIQERLEEIRKEEELRKVRKQKKQKLEEHWEMLRWLVGYIKENKYAWERRREVERD